MNCKLGLALIALVALPAAASAQSTESGEVAVEGSVRPICILGDPTPALVDLGQLSASSGPRTGRIAVIPSRTVILPASYCNFAGSVVSISATALTASDATAPSAGFARAVNYTASATGWATGASSATTAALGDGTTPTANGTGATQPLPKVADISLTLSSFTAPGDQILVAGNYSGNVIVTLGPALAGGEN
ncbi:hypothetical protein ACQKOE_16270 [Novosphingobium sp. NPDC080210]|jgi:hypothetical protein|uniref:hypothetical protein n=1 Tax=unclassified Novosphingobium TaxID=2644732 RepID=UPI00323AC44E